jgi:serine/threonine protein kinase
MIINDFSFNEDDIIGKGGFSIVYKGKDVINNNFVAIKVDKKKRYNKKESLIYDLLENENNMVKKLNYFEDEDSSYLIMPLYYKSCEKIFKKNKNSFNEKDILMIGIQILQQLNYLHKNYLIHQDVKPDNFIFDKNSNKFKLIDFGLCKRYMRDEKHIKFEKNKSRCGTIRFMSINCHNKFLLSRRDDLISLSYSLIYLNLRMLPWKNIKLEKDNSNDIHKRVKKLKKDFDVSVREFHLLSPLYLLYKYSTNLKFNTNPDYNFLIKGFYNYLKMNGMRYDGRWNWLIVEDQL